MYELLIVVQLGKDIYINIRREGIVWSWEARVHLRRACRTNEILTGAIKLSLFPSLPDFQIRHEKASSNLILGHTLS